MGPDHDRSHNFAAGPGVLPLEVLEELRNDLLLLEGAGAGILEISHRGEHFAKILADTEARLRALAGIPESWEVLFLPGGASTQFFQVPLLYLTPGKTADYLVTGHWAAKARDEAAAIGSVHTAWDGEATGYDRVPRDDEIRLSESPVYVHYTSNNTIYGTRFSRPPWLPAPLVADKSSDMLAGPLDLDGHVLVYASAQKNLGPAGVTLVLIRKDFLDSARDDVPSMLRYRLQARRDSCLNTPPVFSIHAMGRVLRWIEDQGGLTAMAGRNEKKAALVCAALDARPDFYRGLARPDSRSLMNVCFRSPSPELDRKLITEAERRGLIGLTGYRDVGGLRASLYNACPIEACEALAELLGEFGEG